MSWVAWWWQLLFLQMPTPRSGAGGPGPRAAQRSPAAVFWEVGTSTHGTLLGQADVAAPPVWSWGVSYCSSRDVGAFFTCCCCSRCCGQGLQVKG